jgi:O-antigen ligase
VRWILGLGAPLALLIAISFLPATVRYRYSGILGTETAPSVSADAKNAASASSEARRYLLLKSLEFTINHPMFGVGAGNFSSFEGASSRAGGRHGQWQETHNSYTEISSEDGLPAALCYIAAIICAFSLLNRTISLARRNKIQPMVSAGFCCMLSLTMICTCMAFLSMAYRFYLPGLTGIAIALERVMRMEFLNQQYFAQPVAPHVTDFRGVMRLRGEQATPLYLDAATVVTSPSRESRKQVSGIRQVPFIPAAGTTSTRT